VLRTIPIFFIFVCVLCLSSFSSALIITVDDDAPADFSKIQDAINDADDGDTVLVAQGHYYENIDFWGKAITLISSDPCDPCTVADTIIDANGDGIVVSFHNNESEGSVLSGFTITGGHAKYGAGICCWSNCSPIISYCVITENHSGDISDSRGAGIYCQNSNPNLSNCIISGNSTRSGGGGMCNYSFSNPTLTNCTFTTNSASDGAGMFNLSSYPTLTNCTFCENYGIGMLNYNSSSPTLVNCSFNGNSWVGMYNWDNSNPNLISCNFIGNINVNGQGMFNCESSPTLINCTFSSNSADTGGGGMLNESSNPTLTNCIFTGNSSSSCGGGMCNLYSSSPTLTNCNFISNSADNSGGGMYNSDGLPYLTNCNFISNSSLDYDGGGMYNFGCSPIVTNCSFDGNSANNSGGGMHNYHNSSPTITNSIFIGNKVVNGYGGGICCEDNSGPVIRNCTISGNQAATGAGGIDLGDFCDAMITNNIISHSYSGNGIYVLYSNPVVTYNNVYGNADGDYGGWASAGEGDISVDPCFVDPGSWQDPCNTPTDPTDDIWVSGDYHLKSAAGRWDPCSLSWVNDTVTSLCIDAGDPCSTWTGELWPHGGRINMGAYGNTSQASMSLNDAVGNLADLNYDGLVNIEDFSLFAQRYPVDEILLVEDMNRDGTVDTIDLSILADEWLMSDF